MRILISDKLYSGAKKILENFKIKVDEKIGLSNEELLKTIPNYDGLIIRSSTRVTAEVIDKGKNLKVIGRAGIGVDNVDVSYATKNGIVVMNTPNGNSVTTAEHTIALLMSLARKIPAAHLSAKKGNWEKQKFLGTELFGKKLGIIGCGNIGTIVAQRAIGLKMKILGYDPFLSDERAKELSVKKVELNELLYNSDFITLHLPLTQETKNIISKDAINKMKKGVKIINCARGGLVDELALYEGLMSKHISGAALDVFLNEPSLDNPLYNHVDFIGTPHLGASTVEAQEKVAIQIAQQIADFLIHKAVSNSVNMPSLSSEEAEILKPFVRLSELLGCFLGQVHNTEVKKFEIELDGKVAQLNDQPILSSALFGFLRNKMNSINLVNVSSIASTNGISTSVIKHDRSCDYQSMIRINIKYNDKIRTIAGTLFGGNLPRIIELQGIKVEANFPNFMLYIRNHDKPGFIGELGSLIGKLGINIANFHLGRKSKDDEALAIVEIDEELKIEHIEEIKSLSGILSLNFLRFD